MPLKRQGRSRGAARYLIVFCPGKSAPYRIDFFDDTIESIHEFDPISSAARKKVV